MHNTKFDLAFDALEFANGNVTNAKAIIAKRGERISARTWHKAITARIAHLSQVAAKRAVQVPTSVRLFQKALWDVACIAQGTDPKETFVVMNEDNESAKAYNSFALAVQKAIEFAAGGNSALIYQSKLNPLEFGAALTLPTFGDRVGDRIYPPLPEFNKAERGYAR